MSEHQNSQNCIDGLKVQWSRSEYLAEYSKYLAKQEELLKVILGVKK